MSTVIFLLLCLHFCALGQTTSKQKKDAAILHYIVDERGDTVFTERIRPAYVYAYGTRKGSGINWKKHYRLVYNFNVVYPYCKMGGRIIARVDSTLAGKDVGKKDRKKYIDNMQDELLTEFEPVIRKMTISQGQLLCRLIDREIGKSSYQIVKDYKNTFAAGFWQGVARLFGQNLKASYDPNGQDKETEELIHAWERGEFEYIYFSVFGKWPEHTFIPSQYR